MTVPESMREAFDEVVARSGAIRFCEVDIQRIKTGFAATRIVLVKKGELPAEFVLRVEKLTGCSRFRLRPDVFCEPDDLKSAA